MRRPLVALLAAASILVTVPLPPASAAPAGPKVSFPLKHDFSMVPGLPGHNETEPTSCYETWDNDGYLCRIVSGYEEAGYEHNFHVHPSDALDTGHDDRYGASLVSRRGFVYEGCTQLTSGPWAGEWGCDYRTWRQISRQHYESKGYVSQVFWKWKDYLKEQLACAGAVSGLWGGAASKGFLVFLDDCNNGPL
jgi:hypothetical protein